MDKISTVEVNGTEYEVVGPGGEYPISVVNTGDSTGDDYSNNPVSPSFYWRRTGSEGSYEYSLVAFVEQDPQQTYYADTDPS